MHTQANNILKLALSIAFFEPLVRYARRVFAKRSTIVRKRAHVFPLTDPARQLLELISIKLHSKSSNFSHFHGSWIGTKQRFPVALSRSVFVYYPFFASSSSRWPTWSSNLGHRDLKEDFSRNRCPRRSHRAWATQKRTGKFAAYP
jgi:hypothetical protein